jgi:hypothetical protein
VKSSTLMGREKLPSLSADSSVEEGPCFKASMYLCANSSISANILLVLCESACSHLNPLKNGYLSLL